MHNWLGPAKHPLYLFQMYQLTACMSVTFEAQPEGNKLLIPVTLPFRGNGCCQAKHFPVTATVANVIIHGPNGTVSVSH